MPVPPLTAPPRPAPHSGVWRKAPTLARFRKKIPALLLTERECIVDAALALLADYYVHLPQKQATHGIDPLARLRVLRRRLAAMGRDADFHRALADVLDGLGDLHTNYLLPAALGQSVAFLPFQLGEHAERGEWRVIVTEVAPGFEGIKRGEPVRAWNGVPFPRALERAALRTAGANAAACRAQALAALTMRPLAKRPPPDEDWVAVQFGADPTTPELRVEWRVLTLPEHHTRQGASVDMQVDALRRARRTLFALPAPFAKPAMSAGGARVSGTTVATGAPRLFTAAELQVGRLRVGYVRVNTFLTRDADAFVTELARLLTLLPPRGLILDVRDNGGGSVEAAERSLQLFTPHPIEPAPMQLRATLAVLALCGTQAPANPDRVTDLSPWRPSVQRALETGAPYSAALPITDPASCNVVGQRYHGPVVLLTSALCYSAADIFAAGFQDHRIGPVLGVHASTGAGGANVWPLGLLQRALGVPPGLPHGAELRVALRRSLRVGPNAGLELEERGVVPDHAHSLTKRDLLNDGPDLLAHAARLLLDQPWRQLDATLLPGRRLKVRLRHADRLDTHWNNRPILSQDVPGGPGGCTVRIDLPTPGEVRLLAYASGALVAARTIPVT